MIPAFLVVACVALFVSRGEGQQKSQLKTMKDSVSYSIGVNLGKNIQRDSLELNIDLLARGIKDVLAGKVLLTDNQLQSVLTAFQRQMMAKQEQKAKALAEQNKLEGEAFFAENKKKVGVVTLASGLQYKVLKIGTGKKPKATDTVTVNYRGTFLNGMEFDNSYTRGEPATFAVNAVIPGWSEALQLMPAGSKWQLWIPASLGYGEQGAGQTIPPNATLVFEVELLSIK